MTNTVPTLAPFAFLDVHANVYIKHKPKEEAVTGVPVESNRLETIK